jgi:hypothetical protein
MPNVSSSSQRSRLLTQGPTLLNCRVFPNLIDAPFSLLAASFVFAPLRSSTDNVIAASHLTGPWRQKETEIGTGGQSLHCPPAMALQRRVPAREFLGFASSQETVTSGLHRLCMT